MLQRLIQRLVNSSNRPTMMADGAREKALDTLAEHGINAHFYLPAAGCANKELASALRLLGDLGYLMTDANGSLVGKVAKARLTADERAQESRKRFLLVEK
jgi:hypothetical protein